MQTDADYGGTTIVGSRIDAPERRDYRPLSEDAAMSVNKVLLIGNLGKDPEVRFTGGGQAVARFPVATSEVWNDREGQRQERTEWHNVVVWAKQAEACGQYLQKGRQVYIEGSIRTRQYDDKDGNKRYMTEVIAQRVQFLGGRGGDAPSRGAGREQGGSEDMPPAPLPEDDDIPF
jgi:single-strand DNA-binding protein